ncbi:MAG: NUDIX domain-containing protein [Dehalococcoidia bacterium]|nr:MAG: NUDIX domain-containing protein [Dehalococcoidia bacterium]
MANSGPLLLSGAMMVRDDGLVLLVQHPAASPFAGKWSMPLTGVPDHETAEDALERMLRGALHVEPGAYDFLDTIYVNALNGSERFIVNAFTCIDWNGEPRFGAEAFADAAWVSPGAPGNLDLLTEVREWLKTAYEDETGALIPREYDRETLLADLASARGDVIAAFDAVPAHLRTRADTSGWSPIDVFAHVADVEAYYRSEIRRCLSGAGQRWRLFNEAQWDDTYRLRPAEDERVLRERFSAVSGETRAYLGALGAEMLAVYLDHPERGVVQVGDRIEKIAEHHRDHANQIRQMTQALAAAPGA